MRHALVVSLLVVVGLSIGCGKDEGDPADVVAACLEDSPPTVGTPEADGGVLDRLITATLSIEEKVDVVNGGLASGELRLIYYDLSTRTAESAPTQPDSATCWRIVGQPVAGTAGTALRASNVSVGGLVSGPLEVPEITGFFRSTMATDLVSAAPVTITSHMTAGSNPTFPDFMMEGAVAQPLRNLRAKRLPDNTLELRWDRTDATYVEFQLTAPDPAAPNDLARANRVICRVRDDGCHRVPSSSVLFVALMGQFVQLGAERHALTVSTPSASSVATVDVQQSTTNEINLATGELRY